MIAALLSPDCKQVYPCCAPAQQQFMPGMRKPQNATAVCFENSVLMLVSAHTLFGLPNSLLCAPAEDVVVILYIQTSGV